MTGADQSDPPQGADPTVGSALFAQETGPGSAMAHLYRGEVHRMTRWRERMDRTTYWAVTVMAAVLTWAFSDPGNPHVLVLVGAVAVLVFLGVEAHRYRGYVVWRTRVRLLQENVWAYGLDPSGGLPDEDWRRELAADYRTPTVKVSYEEALAHRLRRIYLALLTVVLGAWIVRTTVVARTPWPGSAAVGSVPGEAVVAVVLLVYAAALAVALRPRDWKGYPELRTEEVGEWRE